MPVDVLRNHVGMTNSDLQWLVNEGLAEHRAESTRKRTKNRTFRQEGALDLAGRACFVITEAGLRLARGVCELLDSRDSAPGATPHWDAATGKLTYRGRLVKSFAQDASTQSALLDACEAANWINPIPNPWADMPQAKRSHHLRQALYHLNGDQQEVEIRFSSRDKAKFFVWSLGKGGYQSSARRERLSAPRDKMRRTKTL